MDVVSSTAKGLLGLIDKATIYVPSLDAVEAWEKIAMLTGTTGEMIGTMQTLSENLLREGCKGAMKTQEMGGFAGAVAAQGVKKTAEAAALALNTYKKVEVQYNPKTLQIMGLGGTARSYTAGLGMGAENGITQIDNKTSTTLSCELVFTNVNISDAFMTEDLLNFNLESAASNVANMANRLMGNSPSVQPMVDGFISILTTGYTRMIIFAWGSTVFRGELTRVDCQYKMFNKRGDPIMATVNITIRQGFDDNANTSEKHWEDQFKNTFKEIDDIM